MGRYPLNDIYLKEDRLHARGQVVILVSLPRSGKSTWTNGFVKSMAEDGVPFTVVSSDDVRRALRVRWDERLEDQVQAYMGMFVEMMMLRRQHIVIDCCNLSNKDRQRWIDKANAHEYRFSLVHVEPPTEERHREICRRHNFPWEAIEWAKKRYEPIPTKYKDRTVIVERSIA